MAMHATRFPNESGVYRKARDKLLKAEIGLRREIERVAELRRELPEGGAVPEDYVFEEGAQDLKEAKTRRQIPLSKLFQRGRNSLVIYSFMYGPAMKAPCPSCSSIIDSLDGAAPHLLQRANLVIVAKSPLARIRKFARERGWRNLRFLSSANNNYNRDYHGETKTGEQRPMLNVFLRKNGKIHHTFSTELMFVPPEQGQDPRHVDMIWPIWNLLDYTPEGRGKDWRPQLKYK